MCMAGQQAAQPQGARFATEREWASKSYQVTHRGDKDYNTIDLYRYEIWLKIIQPLP